VPPPQPPYGTPANRPPPRTAHPPPSPTKHRPHHARPAPPPSAHPHKKGTSRLPQGGEGVYDAIVWEVQGVICFNGCTNLPTPEATHSPLRPNGQPPPTHPPLTVEKATPN